MKWKIQIKNGNYSFNLFKVLVPVHCSALRTTQQCLWGVTPHAVQGTWQHCCVEWYRVNGPSAPPTYPSLHRPNRSRHSNANRACDRTDGSSRLGGVSKVPPQRTWWRTWSNGYQRSVGQGWPAEQTPSWILKFRRGRWQNKQTSETTK